MNLCSDKMRLYFNFYCAFYRSFNLVIKIGVETNNYFDKQYYDEINKKMKQEVIELAGDDDLDDFLEIIEPSELMQKDTKSSEKKILDQSDSSIKLYDEEEDGDGDVTILNEEDNIASTTFPKGSSNQAHDANAKRVELEKQGLKEFQQTLSSPEDIELASSIFHLSEKELEHAWHEKEHELADLNEEIVSLFEHFTNSPKDQEEKRAKFKRRNAAKDFIALVISCITYKKEKGLFSSTAMSLVDSLDHQTAQAQEVPVRSDYSSFIASGALPSSLDGAINSFQQFPPSNFQQSYPDNASFSNSSQQQWDSSIPYSPSQENHFPIQSSFAAQGRENFAESCGEFDLVSGANNNDNFMRGCKVIAKGKDKGVCVCVSLLIFVLQQHLTNLYFLLFFMKTFYCDRRRNY